MFAKSNTSKIFAFFEKRFSTLKVRRTTIEGVKLYSLALDIAPLTDKINKNTLCILDQSIVRNRT